MRIYLGILGVLFISMLAFPSPAKAQAMDHSAHQSSSHVQAGDSSMPGMKEMCSGCPCCKGMCGNMESGMMKDKMSGMQCKKMKDGHKCGCCKDIMGKKDETRGYQHNDPEQYNQ